jgi:hypothetical protein
MPVPVQITRYETADGVQFDHEDEAIRWEVQTYLTKLVGSIEIYNLLDVDDVVRVILQKPTEIMSVLKRLVEAKEGR